jgi:hypothetical protein
MNRKATGISIVTVIGIDIGKNTFHLVGLDQRGAIALRQKLSRGQVASRLANVAPWSAWRLNLAPVDLGQIRMEADRTCWLSG